MATLRRGRAKGCASTLGIGLLLLAGCAAKNAEGRASASPASRTSVQAEALKAKCADCECPEGLAQAGVSVSNTDGGVALTFITSEDEVAELRARVRHMADVNNRGTGDAQPTFTEHEVRDEAEGEVAPAPAPRLNGGMPLQQEGLHTMHGGRPGQRPYFGTSAGSGSIPSTAAVEDVDGGARLVLTPRDSNQLAALRERVSAHVRRVQDAECAMLAAERKETGETYVER